MLSFKWSNESSKPAPHLSAACILLLIPIMDYLCVLLICPIKSNYVTHFVYLMKIAVHWDFIGKFQFVRRFIKNSKKLLLFLTKAILRVQLSGNEAYFIIVTKCIYEKDFKSATEHRVKEMMKYYCQKLMQRKHTWGSFLWIGERKVRSRQSLTCTSHMISMNPFLVALRHIK